jgi:hypothetical protein
MRTLFLVLLMLNLALFAWVRGTFGAGPLNGREPSRLEQQIAVERIRVLTERDVQQLAKRASETKPAAPAPVGALPLDATVSCMEIGEFVGDAQLARLRDKLAELKLTDRASEQSRERPGWFLVYLPPEKTLADAEQRLEQLRAQGLRDLFVLRDESPLRFGIAVGSFRDRDLARKQVALLERRGVKGARVGESPTAVRSTRVLIRGAEVAAIRQLQEAQKDFPQQKLQPCSPEPAT